MIPPCPCPICGQYLDSADGIGLAINKNPEPGDITVCFYCCSIMAFDEQLTLRNLTSAEMHEVAGDRRIVALINEIAEVKKDHERERTRTTKAPGP